MNSKGVGSTWWIIIAAVIALVVMIVLISMFTSGTTKANRSLLDCEGKGGTCIAKGSACKNVDGTDGSITTAFSCENKQQVCCFKSK